MGRYNVWSSKGKVDEGTKEGEMIHRTTGGNCIGPKGGANYLPRVVVIGVYG